MQISSYKEAKEYLESLIKPTIFRKIELKEATVKDPLSRMYTLLEFLGNPQEKFPAIQVSGTSGKGSTAYLISHMLTTAGYRTGFTMSPHLIKINERIQLNDKEISDEDFISLINTIKPIVEKMANDGEEPSYFEITMAMSFLFFAESKVDIAVVEVGIEGNYDASNTCQPIVSVLTNIDLDHTDILGETVEDIAKEAVSVIRKPVHVHVAGVKQDSVVKIVEQKAKDENITVALLGKDFTCEQKYSENKKPVFDYFDTDGELRNVQLNMMGDYQMENAAIAIKAVRSLSGFTITEQAIRQALSSSFFPGRFELINYTLNTKPYTLILDGAHNPAKMKSFITSLQFLYPNKKKIFIVAFKSNKDITAMLSHIVPVADVIIITKYFVTPDYQGPPGAEVASIEEQIKKINITKTPQLFSENTVEGALNKSTEILKLVQDDNGEGLIVVTGSLYLVGEARALLTSR